MKRYYAKRRIRYTNITERQIARKIRQERADGFKCSHCKRWVVINQYIGTANRNHCNLCLWSKHVDVKKGDRKSHCQAGMRPVGLTFRIEGNAKRGEIMLIHACSWCPKISINRIARDDGEQEILSIFEGSMHIPGELKARIEAGEIYLADAADKRTLLDQLFGHGYHC